MTEWSLAEALWHLAIVAVSFAVGYRMGKPDGAKERDALWHELIDMAEVFEAQGRPLYARSARKAARRITEDSERIHRLERALASAPQRAGDTKP